MTDLIALAERCEASAGPDRELDCAILVAIDWREPDWEEGDRTAKEMADRHGVAWLASRTTQGMSIWRHLPRLTASLDSAMSLVSGQDFGAGSKDATGKAWAWVGAFDGPDHISNAATPALALVAAALRARAAL